MTHPEARFERNGRAPWTDTVLALRVAPAPIMVPSGADLVIRDGAGRHAGRRERYKKVSWSIEHEGLRLWVGYDSWPAHAKREEYEHRNISFTVRDGERVIATGDFVEWEFNYPPENWVENNNRAGIPNMNWFFDWADGWSQSSSDAAEIVRTFWPDKDFGDSPFNYGSVVIFDRLKIDAKTAGQSAAVWALMHKLISRQFLRPRHRKNNRAAIFILKPFPLEYEGNITKENDAAFERRRAAMIRHYGARLNARLLDDHSWISKDRWMWIDTGCPIKPRKVRQRKSVKKLASRRTERL